MLPQLEALFEKPIGGEENKHASWCHLGNLGDCLSEVENHRERLSVFVAKVKTLAIDTLFQNADQHLVRTDNVRVFQLLSKVNLKLRLERLQGCQRT